MLLAFMAWVKTNSSFIIMALIGATIAHIKAYEAKNERQTKTWHIYTFGVKICYAAFVSMVVFHLHVAYQWNDQWSFIMTGLLSIFADDAINMMWRTFRRRFAKEVGLPEDK